MKCLDSFMFVYRKHLAQCHSEGLYVWPVQELDIVADRMRTAFARGSYSNDGPAINRTCKELGIKPTYTAINTYINGASHA